MTTEWTVTWTIQVDGDTAEEAARTAQAIQRDRSSTANVFYVHPFEAEDEDDNKCPGCELYIGGSEIIDLDEEDGTDWGREGRKGRA